MQQMLEKKALGVHDWYFSQTTTNNYSVSSSRILRHSFELHQWRNTNKKWRKRNDNGGREMEKRMMDFSLALPRMSLSCDVSL
ncbi:hypothetical protein F3Y22_tig00110065pilonHSYRG00257 [Hibiscus syriacus]|uniref:Uncharacterized protein n=1 Tax=Hibiscus syriacus TaxID=106335 RepID=A0A6A3BPL7_HIBSY|nr:hypothetical protein F3Y22_tig00110065pilonHSYRG00257 [Hibiscus syriacus]